jgi:hypothetical protein
LSPNPRKERDEFVAGALETCTAQHNKSEFNRQIGITDQEISTYCNCYANALVKVITVGEIRNLIKNGKALDSLQQKIALTDTVCTAEAFPNLPAEDAHSKGVDTYVVARNVEPPYFATLRTCAINEVDRPARCTEMAEFRALGEGLHNVSTLLHLQRARRFGNYYRRSFRSDRQHNRCFE